MYETQFKREGVISSPYTQRARVAMKSIEARLIVSLASDICHSGTKYRVYAEAGGSCASGIDRVS